MIFSLLSILLASLPASASCPDLNGKFACSYGPIVLPVEIQAKPQSKGGFLYQVNGKSVLINSQEQVMNELSANKGINFKNISYIGSCGSGVMSLRVKGSNGEGSLEGNADALLRFTNRGQLSIHVNASWDQMKRKFAILCTPTR